MQLQDLILNVVLDINAEKVHCHAITRFYHLLIKGLL